MFSNAEVAVKKVLASLFGGLAFLAAIFGAGTANADNEYAGLTYEKAVARMGGQTPVIASRVGDYLPTEQCIVTGSRSGNFLDSSGNNRGGQVLLHLNCNGASAMGGHPGNSVMSPAGKADLQQREIAKDINEGYAQATAAGEESWCEKNASSCYRFCERTGYCSEEVNELLGL